MPSANAKIYPSPISSNCSANSAAPDWLKACAGGGGYILAAPPAQINIAQIISAAEDRLDATQCGSKANCHHGAPCLTHDLWENLNKTINDYLGSVTLQSIIEQKNNGDGSRVVQFTHIH